MPLIGARFYTMVDDALVRGDEIENQLRYLLIDELLSHLFGSLTLENGRLFRLICKLGVSDRGEYGQYETGDRYLLKLFRSVFLKLNSSNNISETIYTTKLGQMELHLWTCST